MALQVRPLVVHLDISPIFVFLPWYFFPFERQSRVFFTIQATLTVLLLPLVASQLASFEQLRRAWLGLVTNNNPCKESLLYHHWFMGVASKELNYIFPTCRQIREHPSHHRGPGWEQGGQVYYDHNLLAISVILWGSPWFSQMDIHHRSLAGTYPFNLNNGGVSLFTLCDFILLQPIVGYTEPSVHNIKYYNMRHVHNVFSVTPETNKVCSQT